VPVDPGVQQLMRNALDDLTRPVPPVVTSVMRTGRALTVQIAPSADPRLRDVVVRAWTGVRWRPFCAGVTSCSGSVWPAAPAPVELGAVTLDAWGRRSAAVSVFG
jgi:hypothetical protein